MTTVCIIYDTNNGAHLEGPGVFHLFQKLMLKDSQTHHPSKCATFYGAQHIFSPANLFQNMISKSVYHICTTAEVIRVKSEKFLNIFSGFKHCCGSDIFTTDPYLNIEPLQKFETKNKFAKFIKTEKFTNFIFKRSTNCLNLIES